MGQGKNGMIISLQRADDQLTKKMANYNKTAIFIRVEFKAINLKDMVMLTNILR